MLGLSSILLSSTPAHDVNVTVAINNGDNLAILMEKLNLELPEEGEEQGLDLVAIRKRLTEINESLSDLSELIDSVPEMLSGLEDAYAGMAQAQLDAAVQFATASAQLTAAETQLAGAKTQYESAKEEANKRSTYTQYRDDRTKALKHGDIEFLLCNQPADDHQHDTITAVAHTQCKKQ